MCIVVGIDVEASEEHLSLFYVTMEGPKDTLYEGGNFKLQMFVPKEYPFKPPKCLFTTPIYHVNVNELGK